MRLQSGFERRFSESFFFFGIRTTTSVFFKDALWRCPADIPMKSSFLKTALVLGLLSAIGPFAIDMYLPALPSIGQSLDALVMSWITLGGVKQAATAGLFCYVINSWSRPFLLGFRPFLPLKR